MVYNIYFMFTEWLYIIKLSMIKYWIVWNPNNGTQPFTKESHNMQIPSLVGPATKNHKIHHWSHMESHDDILETIIL